MGLDKVRMESDTDYSSSTNYHQRLRQLRRRHGYVSSETAQKTVTNDREQVTDSAEQPDVSRILKRAKPALPDEAKLALDTIKKFLGASEKKPSRDEYKGAIEKVFETLSPETLAEYKNYGIEFVLNDHVSRPSAERTESGKWELNLPTKYEYPIQGVIFRCFDELLRVEFEKAKDIYLDSARKADKEANAFLRKWVRIIVELSQNFEAQETDSRVGSRVEASSLPNNRRLSQPMLLQIIDEKSRAAEVMRAQVEANAIRVAADAFLTSRRAQIAARVFLTNMQLGEKYGWSTKGEYEYQLAEKYSQDYDKGICEAFEEGLINKNTPKDLLIQNGNKYAVRQLLDSIMPREGVPKIFPSMYPGSYFEEFNIKEREKKRDESSTKGSVKFRVEKPINLSTEEFDKLMKGMSERKEKGKEYSIFNIVIMAEKTIWVLPALFQEGEKSQHSIVAKGNPCVWAGEGIIERDNVNRVISLRDQSGHIRTMDYCDKVQKAISNFALQAFRDQGYEVPQEVELTVKRT